MGEETSVTLKNIDEKIQFLEPCPQVHWAGTISRERTFLINQENMNDNLSVTIFNPNRRDGKTLNDMSTVEDPSNRLISVRLQYRKDGESEFKDAIYNGDKKVDFLLDDGEEEDEYG